IYFPLPASQDEFRLIELLPASEFKAPIVCHLIHSNLRSPPKYDALSYVWGRPPFTVLIKLDASPTFAIRKNPELVLRHFRFPKEKMVLWVDALCIDQADRDERSQQVGRMRDIFQLFESVLVYLGP
ncbi:heterokaryon incompatibility protein-domain-containing protein, partial [Bisporella sp. PMI_857]